MAADLPASSTETKTSELPKEIPKEIFKSLVFCGRHINTDYLNEVLTSAKYAPLEYVVRASPSVMVASTDGTVAIHKPTRSDPYMEIRSHARHETELSTHPFVVRGVKEGWLVMRWLKVEEKTGLTVGASVKNAKRVALNRNYKAKDQPVDQWGELADVYFGNDIWHACLILPKVGNKSIYYLDQDSKILDDAECQVLRVTKMEKPLMYDCNDINAGLRFIIDQYNLLFHVHNTYTEWFIRVLGDYSPAIQSTIGLNVAEDSKTVLSRPQYSLKSLNNLQWEFIRSNKLWVWGYDDEEDEVESGQCSHCKENIDGDHPLSTNASQWYCEECFFERGQPNQWLADLYHQYMIDNEVATFQEIYQLIQKDAKAYLLEKYALPSVAIVEDRFAPLFKSHTVTSFSELETSLRPWNQHAMIALQFIESAQSLLGMF